MPSTATAAPASLNKQEISQLSINTIRTLAMDAVEAANSGHPGTPMALAPVAYTLWNEVLRYDPADPLWPGRDRFVLSCGHASMLLYSMLHLAGVKQVEHGKVTDELAVPLEHIKQFRQLAAARRAIPKASKPAASKRRPARWARASATSVGMAIAQRWLAGHFNRPGFELFDYNIYALCSDGDMMEGVSNEAASIAGHLKLSNLCWIYDDNHITIEGNTELAFSDEVATRFEGLGWHVLHVADANDLAALRRAYQEFQATTDKPTMIIVRSHIGYGSPHKQDTNEAHGEALGEEEIRLTKKVYGWPEDAKFLVPEAVAGAFRGRRRRAGAKLHAAWEQKFKEYAAKYPELAAEWQQMAKRELPEGWDAGDPHVSGRRQGSGQPHLVGQGAQRRGRAGSLADRRSGRPGPFDDDPSDVRQRRRLRAGQLRRPQFPLRHPRTRHGRRRQRHGAVSFVRPYGSTFFVFTDYMRPSMRLERHHALPVDLDFHARFDRPGRRRADASADRASGRLPGDSRI